MTDKIIDREAVRKNPPAVMNVHEAAAFLGVSLRTMYNLAARGQVPAVKVSGMWRFPKEDLETWLAEKARNNLGDK